MPDTELTRTTKTKGREMPFLDIAEPEQGVEVQIKSDGSVLWIHVDGVTVLRVCRIKKGMINIDDARAFGDAFARAVERRKAQTDA